MKLWTSGEVMHDVGKHYRLLAITFENKINEILEPVFLRESLNEWPVIAMILPEGFIDYKEVIKYSKRDKEFEFRLEIDHPSFLAGDFKQKLHLFANMLRRSIDLMADFPAAGVTKEDQDYLRAVVDQVEEYLIANPVPLE